MAGGAYRGGSFGGGVYRGGASVYHGGNGGVYHNGNGGHYGGYRGYYGGYRGYYGNYYGAYYGGYYPYLYAGFGFNYGYWPSYPYYGYSYPDYSYSYGYPAAYQSSPNVTVVYAPPASQTPVYVERPNPVVREYDEYGQQTNRTAPASGAASPIYLIAFRDGAIRAAASYWVEGGALHYVTLDRQQQQAPLDSVDRELSARLNRERRVSFTLPSVQ